MSEAPPVLQIADVVAGYSAGVDILTNSVVDTLVRRGRLITGVVVSRGDGLTAREARPDNLVWSRAKGASCCSVRPGGR